MRKNDKNLKSNTSEQDNTYVDYQIPYEIVQKALPSEQIRSYYETYGYPEQPVLSSDVRTEQERELAKQNYTRNKAKENLKRKLNIVRNGVGFVPLVGDFIDLGITGLEVATGKENPSMLGLSALGFVPGGDFAKIKNWARARLINRAMSNIKTPIIPRVNQIELIYQPPKRQIGKTSLKFYERPQSKLTEAEKAGIPKGDRNQSLKTNPLAGVESEVDTYLINRTNTPFTFVDGKLVWMPGNARSGESRATVHFTTDQPVIDHGSGSWAAASETFLTPYQQVVRDNGMPMNIEPMDTWFSNQYPFIIRQNGSRIFTSNPRNYYKYLQQGIDVETSKEAQEIYQQIQKAMKERDILEQAFVKTGYAIGSPEQQALIKYSAEVLDPLLRKHDIIHRNWVKANNRRPTLDTYKQLEKETGLISGVTDYRGKMDYYNAPATHSNIWYTDTMDAKQRFDTFLYQLIEYPNVIKQQDYQLFEQLARKYPELVKDFIENKKGVKHWSGFKSINTLPKEVQQILYNVYNRGYKTGGKLMNKNE